MEKIEFLVVSGFLGAGKTTTMIALAEYMDKNVEKVGIIANDLGAQLVDRVLDETVEAKKDAVTMFRTVLIEREAVARLADRAGMADVHVLYSVENDCAALAA